MTPFTIAFTMRAYNPSVFSGISGPYELRNATALPSSVCSSRIARAVDVFDSSSRETAAWSRWNFTRASIPASIDARRPRGRELADSARIRCQSARYCSASASTSASRFGKNWYSEPIEVSDLAAIALIVVPSTPRLVNSEAAASKMAAMRRCPRSWRRGERRRAAGSTAISSLTYARKPSYSRIRENARIQARRGSPSVRSADHGDGDDRRHPGADRLVDRQRRAADDRGQPRRLDRRSLVGGDGLSARQRARHAAERLADRALRP